MKAPRSTCPAAQHQSFDRCGRSGSAPSLTGMGKVIVSNQVTVNGSFDAPTPEECATGLPGPEGPAA